MEKLKCSFPTSCKQSYPQFHMTASYTHSHNADDYGIPLISIIHIDTYEAIIFGGWACAGSISKISWFKGNMDKWADKKLIAFCVGGSPIDNPEIDIALKRNFNESEQKKVKTFYCPGGFNYENMSTPSKLMMKMFIKTLKAKKDKTEAEEIMVKMISSSYDISDKKYIEPILQYLKK